MTPSEREALARQCWAMARGFDLMAPHWDDLDPVMQQAVTDAIAHATALATPTPTEDT